VTINKDGTYSDEYGNVLAATADEDLMAGSVKKSWCRRCGQWYDWDETHVDEGYFPGGGCNWRALRGVPMPNGIDTAPNAQQREAWQLGFDFASEVHVRAAKENAALLAQVVTRMLGKDRADGEIVLRVYPDPKVYDWEAES